MFKKIFVVNIIIFKKSIEILVQYKTNCSRPRNSCMTVNI